MRLPRSSSLLLIKRVDLSINSYFMIYPLPWRDILQLPKKELEALSLIVPYLNYIYMRTNMRSRNETDTRYRSPKDSGLWFRCEFWQNISGGVYLLFMITILASVYMYLNVVLSEMD